MDPLVRWLLTYLVHSTVLLGAAGLARLALRGRWLPLQEAVLRAALVGGFLTASLQVGSTCAPSGARSPCPARARRSRRSRFPCRSQGWAARP